MRRNTATTVSAATSPSAAESGAPGVSWLAVRGGRVGVVVGHVVLAGAGGGGRVPVLLGRGRRAGSVPGDQHVLGLEPSVSLLHAPDRDDDATPDLNNSLFDSFYDSLVTAYPEDARQLPQRPHPPLRGGDVVDDGDGENGVKTVIFVRKRHVITDKYLGKSKQNIFPLLKSVDHLIVLLSRQLCESFASVNSNVEQQGIHAQIFSTTTT